MRFLKQNSISFELKVHQNQQQVAQAAGGDMKQHMRKAAGRCWEGWDRYLTTFLGPNKAELAKMVQEAVETALEDQGADPYEVGQGMPPPRVDAAAASEPGKDPRPPREDPRRQLGP